MPREVLWKALTVAERIRWIDSVGYAATEKDRERYDTVIKALVPEAGLPRWTKWLQLNRISKRAAAAAFRADPPGAAEFDGRIDWLPILEEVLTPDFSAEATDYTWVDGDPLIGLLEPFHRWASVQAASMFSHPALIGLRDGAMKELIRELWRLSHRCFILEANAARLAAPDNEAPRERLQRFLRSVTRDRKRLTVLYFRYPALLRALAIQCMQWRTSFRELGEVYLADLPEIETKILASKVGALSGFLGIRGDAHDGGRRVRILAFEDGRRLVYKPRTLKGDQAFTDLVDWLNRKGLTYPLTTPRVLVKPRHGWAEFIEARQIDSEDGVGRYYHRLGALIAVLWVVRGVDFHFENILASGEQSYLVDLETLFHNPIGPNTGASVADAFLRCDSILESGLLPTQPTSHDPSVESPDLSGLGRREGQIWAQDVDGIEGAGTDEIRIVQSRYQMSSSTNLPRVDGKARTTSGQEEHMAAGFREAYEIFRKGKAELLSSDGPLRGFYDLHMRIVLRATRNYATLQIQLGHPHNMKDAAYAEAFIAPRLMVWVASVPKMRAVVRAEFNSLMVSEIPKFETAVSSRRLMSGGGVVAQSFFDTTAWKLSRRRIVELSSDHLAQQSRLLSMTLCLLSPERSLPVEVRPDTEKAVGFSQAAAFQEVQNIIRNIRSTAVRSRTGMDWYAIRTTDGRLAVVGGVGPYAYEGNAGIAILLAYLTRFTSEPGIKEACYDALKAARRLMKAPAGQIGSLSGGTSAALAMLHAGTVFGDRRLVREAVNALPRLIPDEKVEVECDLLTGLAGVVHVLLMAWELTGNKLLLPLATTLGHRIVARRVEPDRVAWEHTIGSTVPLTGAAHGTAGIASALDRLALATNDVRFRDAAEAALQYERAAFSETLLNWPESRTSASPGLHPYAWCYGLPGILTCRLMRPAILRSPHDVAELTILIDYLKDAAPLNDDSLCHGEFGNLEPLVIASEQLRRPDLLEAARQRAAWTMQRRRRSPQWRCGGMYGHQAEHPGLMLGLAGIGYQLLRLIDPSRVPSLLALETPKAALAPL